MHDQHNFIYPTYLTLSKYEIWRNCCSIIHPRKGKLLTAYVMEEMQKKWTWGLDLVKSSVLDILIFSYQHEILAVFWYISYCKSNTVNIAKGTTNPNIITQTCQYFAAQKNVAQTKPTRIFNLQNWFIHEAEASASFEILFNLHSVCFDLAEGK